MSNAYVNKILFGNTKELVDAKYIEELMPYMLTSDYVLQHSHTEASLPLPEKKDEPETQIPVLREKEVVNQPVFPKQRSALNKNSLFWAIYEIEKPEEAFLGTKANAEITHRIKVIDELKKTPKILKETNSKLTIEQTQALFGAMLTAKEDRLDFCIAYAAFYKKPIVVVYEKTYRVFSPTVEVNISEEECPIVLYASKQSGFSSEKNLTTDILQNIIKTRILGPLRSMSSYKNPELDELAAFLKIPVTQIPEESVSKSSKSPKEKRRSKEDIYNDIKVAIHNDMNFIQ